MTHPLQTSGQVSGGRNSVGMKSGEAPASSAFSRLLADQFRGSSANPPVNGLSTGQAPTDEPVSPRERKVSPEDRPGQESSTPADYSNRTEGGDKGTAAAGQTVAGSESPLTGGPLIWPALSGFLAASGPLGLMSQAGPAVPGFEIIPADVRARLAADMAAGFTDRGGTQTLTLKLEPDHLGSVEVRMQAKGDLLSVRLLVDNREAEIALRQNLKELADSIQERTGKYQQVDMRVELKTQDEPGSRTPGRETPRQDARHHGGDGPRERSRDDSEPDRGADNPGQTETAGASPRTREG